MTKKIIGVDLGGTSVKLAILDVLGNIEAQWSIPTDISDNGKNIVSDIISSFQEYLLENSISLGHQRLHRKAVGLPRQHPAAGNHPTPAREVRV